MITRDVLSINVKKEILSLLDNDKCIIFPTETVYGILALYNSPVAQKKIFELKQRPREKQLQILLADISLIAEFFNFKLEPLAEKIAQRFFPGALTLVIYDEKGKSYGFRIPKHKELFDLLSYISKPIVATSCNIHGEEDCKSFSQVTDLFAGYPLLAFDGGDCEHQISSTVVEVRNNKINILREGVISKELILECCS